MEGYGERPRWDPGAAGSRGKLFSYLRLVRLEHTLFSLPFAYAGALLSGYSLDLWDVLLIGFAVLGLRSAGMAYNNIADRDIDKLNPRTRNRPLVNGGLSLAEAWMVVLAGSLIYFVSAALLNFYALVLSPFLWIIVLSYPYAKRWHSFPHLHLGLALGMVVFGGAIAVSGDRVSSLYDALMTVPYIYVLAVVTWVAGFDILYSIMDIDFDRELGLGSVPSAYGVDGARLFSLFMHVISIFSLILGCIVYNLGLVGFLAAIIASILIYYQHIITLRSLLNIPRAFNLNLAVSVIISVGIIFAKTYILLF